MNYPVPPELQREYYRGRWNVKLVKREPINHDSYIFHFEFIDTNVRFGMTPISHLVLLQRNKFMQDISRAYTITEEGKGYFQIPIKIYRPNVHPDFPNGGQLTPFLESVPLNTEFTVKKTIGKLFYLNRQFYINPKHGPKIPRTFQSVFMVCAGSGITPAYQLIKQICQDKDDKTKAHLLYMNRYEEDIWFRKELDQFQLHYPEKVKVHFALSQPTNNWTGLKGRVNEEMLQSIFPKGNEQTLGLVCGPQPLMDLVLSVYKKMGIQSMTEF